MTRKIKAREGAAPAAKQKPPRQKIAASPAATGQTGGRRGWPILEVALILVLIKILAGAAYIWTRPAETGPVGLAAPRPAALAPSVHPARAGVNLPAQPTAPAAAPVPSALAEDYLAAALKAARPAQAQAAPALPAAGGGALSAGALLVVGGQSGAARAAAIPLPPGGDDLLTPAAKLPPAALPPATAPRLPAAGGSERDLDALRASREREQDLARREALLISKENSLGTLESDLNQRLQTTETAKREIEALLQRNEAVLAEQKALAEQQKKEDEVLRDARLQHLVTAYSGMKPEQAGNLINSMDDDVAVSILSAMPGGKAGKILAMVNPDKAARLTKAISEKRIDPSLLLSEDAAPPAGGEAF
ncbi:hypothetical protein FACS189460_5290 [Deltaproteobacteria bacterium]|nr:hypothetical protein FACS189460_5290 [Deltaproteobacteria bacterium]